MKYDFSYVPTIKTIYTSDIYDLAQVNTWITNNPMWEIIDFRPPKKDDLYLRSKLPYCVINPVYYKDNDINPKLILAEDHTVYAPNNSICVKDTYGGTCPIIPNGYEYVRFGIPRYDEISLESTVCAPRVIIRKKE